MKKIFLFFATLAIILTPVLSANALSIESPEKATIDLFYSPTCSHCKAEIAFLGTLQDKYSELKINKYNVFTKSNVT